MKNKPIVLLILDGWGLSPSWGGNALTMNNPRNMEQLWKYYPHTVLKALSIVTNGEIVGDSRLGHSLIGTGRHVKSNYTLINEKIADRSFYHNETISGAINWAKKNNSNLHLVGLISDGGVHSHIDHLLAILKFCHEHDFNRVYVDAITDGTDSGPTDALSYIDKIQEKMNELDIGKFSSLGGRFWAMDRDKNWTRVGKYYNCLIGEKYQRYKDIRTAISANYNHGYNDEFIEPGLVADEKQKFHPLKKNDAVIMFNFREDRSRQLAKIIIERKPGTLFKRFKRIDDLYFASFINYQREIPAKIIFPDPEYKNSLSEVLARFNLNHIKIAESQKYAHVTYFFNGGIEDPFIGEDRKIISSINIDSFDKAPEMSAHGVADAVVKAIKSDKYDLIVANFANVDMVAHTGNIMATGIAVRYVDKLVRVITSTNLKHGGATIITADHGNAEQMVQLKKAVSEKETLHTTNPVPFILVTPDNRKNLIQSAVSHQTNALSKILGAKDSLADIAPTILELLKIPKPSEMTGHSLLNRLE